MANNSNEVQNNDDTPYDELEQSFVNMFGRLKKLKNIRMPSMK